MGTRARWFPPRGERRISLKTFAAAVSHGGSQRPRCASLTERRVAIAGTGTADAAEGEGSFAHASQSAAIPQRVGRYRGTAAACTRTTGALKIRRVASGRGPLSRPRCEVDQVFGSDVRLLSVRGTPSTTVIPGRLYRREPVRPRTVKSRRSHVDGRRLETRSLRPCRYPDRRTIAHPSSAESVPAILGRASPDPSKRLASHAGSGYHFLACFHLPSVLCTPSFCRSH